MDPILNQSLVWQARTQASSIFGDLGIKLEWRNGQRYCGPQDLRIGVRDDTPTTLMPGALGYALPFEGTHGEVFFDRVRRTVPSYLLPYLLGHVLAHEIAHLLEGTDHHADAGLMKAHWDVADYYMMRMHPLQLTEADVFLIRTGLAARAVHRASLALFSKTLVRQQPVP
jgi:hypothetical protein